jgi:peptide/nickel transport system substrate-binding protein
MARRGAAFMGPHGFWGCAAFALAFICAALCPGLLDAAGGTLDVLNVALSQNAYLHTLDPASWNGSPVLHELFYEGLLDEGAGGSLVPALAESWEESEDGRVYVFRLREGARFSNGAPFGAEAAAYNVLRWTANPLFETLSASRLESAEALDGRTLRLTFTEPSHTILRELAYPRPGRFVEPGTVDPSGETPQPVGTGPFMLDGSGADGHLLSPNPHWWGGRAKARLRFKVIREGQSRAMALLAGELDIAGGELLGPLPLDSHGPLLESPVIERREAPSLGSVFLAFNNDSGLFDDVRVRRALSSSVDRRAISRELFSGLVGEATGLFQDGVLEATPGNNYCPGYDPAGADRLFAEAGFRRRGGILMRPDGRPFELRLLASSEEQPEWRVLSEYLVSAFAERGVKLTVNMCSRARYHDILLNSRGSFDLTLMRTYSDIWLPYGFLGDFFQEIPKRGRAIYWTDPVLKEKAAAARREPDPSKRTALYGEVLDAISRDCLALPLYFQKNWIFYRKDRVEGFEIGPTMYNPVKWTALKAKGRD